MAFLHKKHHPPSNYPPTHRISSPFPFPFPFQRDQRKKAKVEESPLKNVAANMRPPPISDDGLPQAYPFVEEPLRFSFGGRSYGNSLFAEAEKEILYERVNYGHRRRLNHRREGMYAFSSEAEMVASFAREGLF